jgi:hypothetical protein
MKTINALSLLVLASGCTATNPEGTRELSEDERRFMPWVVERWENLGQPSVSPECHALLEQRTGVFIANTQDEMLAASGACGPEEHLGLCPVKGAPEYQGSVSCAYAPGERFECVIMMPNHRDWYLTFAHEVTHILEYCEGGLFAFDYDHENDYWTALPSLL